MTIAYPNSFQKLSFHCRKAAKMLTGSLLCLSVVDKTADATDGSSALRNGLVRFSIPIVLGNVGMPFLTSSLSFFMRD